MKITKILSEENDISLSLTMSNEEFDSLFAVCADCGEIVLKSDAVKYNNSYYCNNCVATCVVCGCQIPYGHACEVADSSALYCEDCWNEETYRCNDCGSHFRYEDSVSRGWDNEYYCNECYDEHADSLLDDYHTMKNENQYMFYGDESRLSVPYMGVELEVDSTENVKSIESITLYNIAYCKSTVSYDIIQI